MIERDSQSSFNASFHFNDPEYSDVTIKIFDVVLYAHRVFICSRSDYFKKALQKVPHKFIEGETKTIEFKEGSGAAYWRVFEYLYTGDYSDELSTTELEDDPELLIDIRVYELADMFLIEGLQTLSETKFKKRIEGYELDDSFNICVQEVYKTSHGTAKEMRGAVVQAAISYVEKRRDKDAELWLIAVLIGNGGLFAIDYFMASSCRLGKSFSNDFLEPNEKLSQFRNFAEMKKAVNRKQKKCRYSFPE
ncbi:hypothetical protein K3495_g6211 [Podosphaera aphanis]|nr:hypothetical protein K3495_g6211 [Podosphaera aphanis]